MESFILSISIIGIAGLAMSWLPHLAKKIYISYSILFLAIGLVLYLVIDNLPWPNPFYLEEETVHLTELIIIISLMNTGLKIDHKFSFRNWNAPFRLVSITMLLCMAGLMVASVLILNFDIASAVLLAAVMAPTDPVLASDIQVGPPNSGKNDVVRFSLTTEAGMNDGMAFPFTWLAIALAHYALNGESWFFDWVWIDLVYRIFMGVLLGYLAGVVIRFLFFYLPERYKVLHIRDGLVALSGTLAVYGLTELLHGYGFVAVFVTAVTIRNYEMEHAYHEKLHAFTDQIERLLLAILLILFGGALLTGILDHLSWPLAFLGIAFVLIIRPISGVIGLLGLKISKKKKLIISFFGIKGIGSFFYLSFALREASFTYEKEIWSLTAFVVLISILLHGLTASKAFSKLENLE